LQLSQFVARDPTNISYQSSLDFERTLQTQITSSITKAGADQLRMKAEYDAMQVEVVPLKARIAEVYRDADRLRTEFMTHLSPFGVVSKERAAIGVEYFTHQMAETQDNQAVKSFALFGRACSHLLGGDTALAIADLDEALRAAPKDPLFLTIRGVARVRSGDFEAGHKDLAEAARADEHDYFARFHFALALCRIDAYVTIEQELKDAMKLAPSSPAPFALIALIKATGHDGIRNPEYALRTAQTACDMTRTKSWDAALALAAAYADKGDFDRAIGHAEEALSAARAGRQAEWCRSALKTFEAGQPLRIDWKTFDYWALW
jgi:tetratricopeptide (TPR) repeat protein